MFRSSLREFDEDPFFSDPFRAHRDHMRQMMRSFSEPFGGPLMPSITDGRSRGRDMAEHPSSSVALRNEHRDMSRSLLPFGGTDSSDMMRNPFGMFDSMMASVRNRMEEMHSNFENMSTDSNAHSFSSSSVMTYSKVGNEPPKVFQATSSTRRAPGGIIETQQAVKDSESGLEKMKIGHHIQDRGHVVEKKINKKTGEREFNQDFQNLDESEAQSFDDEWQQKVSTFQPSVPMSRLNEPQPRAVRQAALTGPEQQPRRDQQRSKSAGRVRIEGSAKK
ncbi:myeloid leukemia factor 1 isoform X2 [Mugil cephalus]|uniref:myeloid leukemia factor 1 isoform X2 n=1 Tax=Mugil cephalus TaxID=48193 RepID=UPI001FB61DCC|nr:myeloid leukemia factor 1 isoform X2 [Mugil cephalus]